MALTSFTNTNSFTWPDGRVGFFVGNQSIPAQKLNVGTLNGSGTAFYNVQAFTNSANNSLVVYIGPSHESGGVNQTIEPIHVHVDRFLTQSGVFQPVAAQHVFASSGKRNEELRGMFFENAGATSANNVLLFIDSVKANYTQIVAVFHAFNVNDTIFANSSDGPITQARWISQQLALRGAKVVLVVNPPTTRFATGGTNESPANDARVEAIHQQIVADIIAKYRLEYGAATHCASILTDPVFTHANFLRGTATTSDGTHPEDPYMLAWVRNHIIAQIVDAVNYQPPARVAPTGLVVNAANRTLSFTKTALDAKFVHQYSVDGGSTWQPVTTDQPIELAAGTYASGAIKVRVAAYGGGVAGPALSSTQAYTISGNGISAAPTANWQNFGFVESINPANVATTGNVWDCIKPVNNYQYDSGLFSNVKFSGNGGVRVVANTARPESQNGFRYGPEELSGATATYGIKTDGAQWWATNNGANGAGPFPMSNNDFLEILREDSVLNWYQNGEKKYTASASGVGANDLYFAGVTAYAGGGANGVQMYAQTGLIAR